jgi:hypothetical protein
MTKRWTFLRNATIRCPMPLPPCLHLARLATARVRASEPLQILILFWNKFRHQSKLTKVVPEHSLTRARRAKSNSGSDAPFRCFPIMPVPCGNWPT